MEMLTLRKRVVRTIIVSMTVAAPQYRSTSYAPIPRRDAHTGHKRTVEKLWREFFADPTQWWDHREEKGNARYPDFKHRKTQEGLWLKGQVQEAIDFFHQMQQEGMNPDTYCFVQVLNACGTLQALEEGRSIHTQVIESGCESDMFVGSSLVDMYAKCGSMKDAEKVFTKMSSRKIFAWTAMILGHVKSGQAEEALELFQLMQQDGVEPDPVIFVGMLNACASLAALNEGRQIHDQIIQRGYESDVIVANCLVDMYAKCGSIKDAQRVFDQMPTRTVVSWTTMLGGYSIHGHAQKALSHFERMCHEGLEMNGVTLLSLLSACSHAGLVNEGLYYFEVMDSVCGLHATVEHYACLVDLLARAGRLHEAKDLIKSMVCEPDVIVWLALLGACRVHGDVELGEHVSKQVQGLAPENAAGYLLVLNTYAAAGKLESMSTE